MKSSPKPPLPLLVRPRVYLGSVSIGPGKIDLLRLIAKTRSIAAAARELEMPYKRAWLLIDALNQGFGRSVVQTISGGKGGGGTTLTPLGDQLVASYTALEKRLNCESIVELEALRILANS